MKPSDRPWPLRAARERAAGASGRPQAPAWTPGGAAAIFDQVMAALPAVAFVKDPDGRYLYANRQLLERLGDRIGPEWFGKTDVDIWPADVAAIVRANDLAALAASAPIRATELLPIGDAQVAFLVTRFPIHTEAGILLGGIGIDVSEHLKANEELRRSQVLLAAATEAAGIGAWELDGSGLIHGFAESWRLFGFDPATTSADMGLFVRLLHPADRDRVVASVEAARRERRFLEIEFRIAQPDGVERWIHTTARPIADEAGLGGRLVGVTRDVTDEHASTASLRIQAAILEAVPDAIVVTDAVGRVTYWNDGAARVFGNTSDEMIGRSIRELSPHGGVARSGRDVDPRTAGAFDGEREWTRPDGSVVHVHLRTRVMRGPDGEVTGSLGVATDITDRKRNEVELQRLSMAVEQAPDAIVITDAEAQIQYVNPAFERTTGYRRDEVLGRNPRILKSGVQSDAFYLAMWAALTSGQTWYSDLVNRRKDGSLFHEEAVISSIRDATGAITNYVAAKRNVTRERALEAEAARHARERALIADTLAALPAQATSEATAQMICRQVVRLAGALSANLMRFTADDRAVPMGFALANGGAPDLRPLPYQRSRHLRERAAQGAWIEGWVQRPWHPYNKTLREIGVRAHAYAPVHHAGKLIGLLAVGSAEGAAAAGLSEMIPALVEFAGVAGALVGPDLAAREKSMYARQRVADILGQLAFHPVFQPIVDLRTDRVVGYEALTRFDDDMAPDEQFAAAEVVGLGLELETATLRAAIAAAHRLARGMLLNLNASPGIVLEGQAIKSLLKGVRRPLVLELTEHAAISDYDAFHHALETLGPSVRLAIDDAGAGFASFRHILELGPAFVKLDRSLVAGIDHDPAKQALVAGMRQFARSTGCRLIAEGVETEDERATLVALGIRLAQGFLLGRPGPLPD